MEPWEMSATRLLAAFDSGKTDPLEAVRSLLERIASVDPQLGAYTVVRDGALADAEAATERRRTGDHLGRMDGVPVAVKELFDVAGEITSFGSAIFSSRVPEHDSAAVARLKAEGAVILGLTRTHEFAWGITTQNGTTGSTADPWDPGRVPGGSSGGSAVAVAARLAPAALGSDTGGSIRIPSSHCGISGFKPSFGRIDLTGVCPLAPSLDHGGPMARAVEDLVLMTEILSPSFRAEEVDISGAEFVVSPDLCVAGPQADHLAVFEAAVKTVESLGAKIEEVSFEGAPGIYPLFSTIQMYEALRVHRDQLGTYPRLAEDYSEAVRRRLERAEEVTEDAYHAAVAERAELRARFEALLAPGKLLLTPASGGAASFRSRPDTGMLDGSDIPFRELVMPYTVPQNLTGQPVCCIPSGFDGEGLPVGLQMTAPLGRDGLALAAAATLSEALTGGEIHPPLD